MKKKVIFAALFFCISISVFAQGFYFDIGAGFGRAWTRFNGENVINILNAEGLQVSPSGMMLSLKAGYGPVADMPIYIVGELGSIWHMLSFDYSLEHHDLYRYDHEISFISSIIGPGILYYPVQRVQLGLSAGLSTVNNSSSLPDAYFSDLRPNSKGGFAWNASAAMDFGRRNHGCLVGVQLFQAINNLQMSNLTENAFLLSIFVKYAYRQKPQLLFF